MSTRAQAPASDRSTEEIVARLRAHGGRMTATRRATLEVLATGDHRHLSAEAIAAEVHQRYPEVAPSTIYRTLAAFEDLGIVTHVHLGHGPSTFHLAGQSHRHLVCRTCGRVTEIPGDELAALSDHLASKYGFSVASEHFALIGDCRACVAAGEG